MRLSSISLATLPIAMAIPLTQTSDDFQDIHVTLSLKKTTSEVSLSAWNQDKSALIGHSCSTTLSTGLFKASPISFKVGENASGSLTIGTQIYTIHENPEISGGISCNSIDSLSEAIVTCAVIVPSSLQLLPMNKENLPECFLDGTLELQSILAGFETDAAVPEAFYTARNTSEPEFKEVETRGLSQRGPCDFETHTTIRVGDGNPHQNPMNVQLSQNLRCEGGTCNVGSSVSRSYSVSWSAGASAFSWINGGYAVQQGIETGNTYECGGGPGETVCVWKNQAQTAYTVQNQYITCGVRHNDGNPFVMWSPNTNNRGGYFYCVRGSYCRSQGDRWLDTNGRAGGP